MIGDKKTIFCFEENHVANDEHPQCNYLDLYPLRGNAGFWDHHPHSAFLHGELWGWRYRIGLISGQLRRHAPDFWADLGHTLRPCWAQADLDDWCFGLCHLDDLVWPCIPIMDALRSGMSGKIIDVMDDEDGEHVEIFVE